MFVASKDRGYSMIEGLSSGSARDPGYGFTLRTPDRHYHFSADSAQERHEWMLVLEHVLDLPMSPQDAKSLYRSSSI